MKVGVIGTGYWGKKHVDEYNQLGHEVIVSDLSKDNLDFCKLNFGAKPVTDYHEILNDEEIKMISICTPNSTHFKLGKEALQAGKNVFLEKPIASSATEATELINLASEKKLVLQTGHLFRFNNAITKTKELIRAKELGRIYTINVSWTNIEPLFPDRDILFDLGVHPLDVLDYIFEQKPSGVYCTGEGFRQDNPEFAIINYHLGDSFGGKDVFVNIVLSWLTPIRSRRMIIVGAEKTAIVDCVLQKIELINNKSGVSEQIHITPNNTIRDELYYFLDKSEKKEPIDDSKPSGEVGKRIVNLIEVATKSLKSNYRAQ